MRVLVCLPSHAFCTVTRPESICVHISVYFRLASERERAEAETADTASFLQEVRVYFVVTQLLCFPGIDWGPVMQVADGVRAGKNAAAAAQDWKRFTDCTYDFVWYCSDWYTSVTVWL